MTSHQRFCLRWNNHQSNLLSVFDQLLQDESFVDVTLAVDGRNLKAHKIVLSACSPYFQALFVGHPDRHPIVILKDIPYCDMRSLLDFMYRGEVSVDQDRLTMFLKVAESLRIKGLTEASGDNCDNLAKMGSTLTSTSHHPVHAGSMSLSYQQRLKRPLSASQHSLNSLQSSNPLLGSALTGPKRKRGLPRKLSGSLSSGLDAMPDAEDGEEDGGRDDDEFEDERSVHSDSDMIERAHSPFDNKMLEVNVSEVKTPVPRPPSSEGDSSSVCNMEERGEGGRSPTPSEREEEDEKQPSQELANNIKMERDTDAPSGGDQNDRNSSPVPERFPPGYLQHLLKLKTLDISRRVYDSVFRHVPPPSLAVPAGELPKDLSRAPAAPLPGALGYPGPLLAGFTAIPPGVFHPVTLKPNMPAPGSFGNEEPVESARILSNMNDDKFYEDMISCSDEDEDEFEESTNNNDYDVDMRKYELSSYKMLERSRRQERGDDSTARARGVGEEGSGLTGGARTGGDSMNLVCRGSGERLSKTNLEYRTDLGELTIETSSSSMPGMASTSTNAKSGVSPGGRSRKHQGSSSGSLSLVPFGSASTSATSPRDRSFIDKASVRQFCTQEGEHVFRCNICLKTYTHISNFCRHFLSAHDDRYKQEISCPVCFKMFTRRDNMMTHTKQVHRITLMRGTLQPVYLDGENGGASQGGGFEPETTAPPPPSSTATSTS